MTALRDKKLHATTGTCTATLSVDCNNHAMPLMLSVGEARSCTAAAVGQTAVCASYDDCVHVICTLTEEEGVGSTSWVRRKKHAKNACRLQQAERVEVYLVPRGEHGNSNEQQVLVGTYLPDWPLRCCGHRTTASLLLLLCCCLSTI